MKKLEDLLLKNHDVCLEINVGGLMSMFDLKSENFELCNKYMSIPRIQSHTVQH